MLKKNELFSFMFKYFSNNGYYTQLVWGETKYVGCAHASFVDDESASRIHRFVCNYGPTGNIANEAVYLQGEPCSKCNLSDGYICDKDFPGLCTGRFSSLLLLVVSFIFLD